MKNIFKGPTPQYFLSLFLFCISLFPVKRVSAQQRSAYDLAAWIIGAVYYSDTATINWALKEGGKIDFKRNGMNALEDAIYNKKPNMVKFLLEKGASIDSVNQDGMNALQYAEKKGNPEVIQLIRSKMKLNTQESKQVNNNTSPVKKNPLPVNVAPAKFNAYKVGDTVLHSRDRGKKWETGIVKEINTTLRSTPNDPPYFLVENITKTSKNYLDPNFITQLTRQSSWTDFFVGDWDLYLPIAATERIIDRDVYRIISGGDRLPPLRIKNDGTYLWVIDKNNVIKGKWKENENAPGLILLQGYRGANWFVYNTTDSDNLKIYKRDYIIISDVKENYTSNHGFRLGKGKK